MEIVEKLSLLAQENKKLHDLLQSVTSTPSDNGFLANVTPILKNSMENATRYAGKQKTQRRHRGLKKFATLLYINAGFMAYQFIQGNIPEALPSLRTVQDIVHSHYEPFFEGQFYFDELWHYLENHHAPLVVTISEDATRIISSVEYDSHSNCCISFVFPIKQNGAVNHDATLIDIDATPCIATEVVGSKITHNCSLRAGHGT